MDKILRGALRFSSDGFTCRRIAAKLCASAPSETSAQTGLLVSLPEPFCLLGIGPSTQQRVDPLPKMSVYDNSVEGKDRHMVRRAQEATGHDRGFPPAPVGRKHLQGLRLASLGTRRMQRSAPKPLILLDLAAEDRGSERAFVRVNSLPRGWASTLWHAYRSLSKSYISPGANDEKASGAASSKRVKRLRKTNFTMSVGPLRCLAMRSSVSSRSSGVAPALKKSGRWMNITTSASCSMAPDSRRSESCGPRSSRSGARVSWLSTSTGTCSSLARPLKPREMLATSSWRLPNLPRAVMSWR